MMNIFLAHVAEVFADYFIVMQVDQAGWHRAKELHIPENIRLIFQPAYSPEVNPVEHLWEEVREKYLHNRIFPSLEDLIDVLCQALSELTEDTERLRSMLFFPHFRMES
jgi:transposase